MYLSLLILSIDGTLLLLFDVSLVLVGGISGGDLSIGGVGWVVVVVVDTGALLVSFEVLLDAIP